jgi:hypothetical protein
MHWRRMRALAALTAAVLGPTIPREAAAEIIAECKDVSGYDYMLPGTLWTNLYPDEIGFKPAQAKIPGITLSLNEQKYSLAYTVVDQTGKLVEKVTLILNRVAAGDDFLLLASVSARTGVESFSFLWEAKSADLIWTDNPVRNRSIDAAHLYRAQCTWNGSKGPWP